MVMAQPLKSEQVHRRHRAACSESAASEASSYTQHLLLLLRIHVRAEHCKKSRCNEAFLQRVKVNDQKKRDAKMLGKSLKLKREPEGPKEMKIVKAKPEDVVVLAPVPFVENYF
ncbi:unnamed protein product [Prorocentrum cordatum]|uniref:Uncharacterized protein n=1 Tax=Prorocentrum cordatum TaxID=2364126 RepID=A0ABN9Y9Q5_9DINO|nr:unnamed protein product [Polarella glacialis]